MSCADTTANPSASDRRRRLQAVPRPAVADVSCRCPRPKLPPFLKGSSSAKPQLPHHHRHHHHHGGHSYSSSSSSSSAGSKTTSDAAVAVTVDSTDPYADFRASMLEMIVEMRIYRSDDELRRLLGRYLALNLPSHRRVIVRAFADAHRAAFWPHSLDSPASRRSATAACDRCADDEGS